jgi:hypothetical protein
MSSDDGGYTDRKPAMMMITPKIGSTTKNDGGNNEKRSIDDEGYTKKQIDNQQ